MFHGALAQPVSCQTSFQKPEAVAAPPADRVAQTARLVLSAQTPAQVVTSWALHRGLVTLHTPSSLGFNAAPKATPQPILARRGSSASNVDLGKYLGSRPCDRYELHAHGLLSFVRKTSLNSWFQ